MMSIKYGYGSRLFDFVATVISILVSVHLASCQPGVIINPESQSVTLNAQVRLQCRVSPERGMVVDWLKDNFGMGSTRALVQSMGSTPRFNYSRYDLPYDLSQGEYDLQISNVDLSDDAIFHCQVKYVNERVPSISQKAVIKVLVPSQPPQMFQNNHQVSLVSPAVVKEFQNLVVECRALKGKPAARITWDIIGYITNASNGTLSQGRLNGNIVVSSTNDLTNKKLINSISVLTLTNMVRTHNNLVIKCSAHNEGYVGLRQAETKIQVNYGPEVTIEPDPKRANNQYTEHEVVTFRCKATGRPENFFWTWYHKNSDIGVNEPLYQVRITRAMDGTSFKCKAMVNDNSGEQTIQINVLYGPQFNKPNSELIAANVGETQTMECTVNSKPESSIEWKREGSLEVLNRGPRFERVAIQRSDFGTYICTATVDNFTPISKKIFLSEMGPPVIQSGPVAYGRRGKEARIRCAMTSVPVPQANQITWIKDGAIVREEETTNSYISFKLDLLLGGAVSTLYIGKVRQSDFGVYNCTVNNGKGIATAAIKLVPYDLVPIPFIAGASVAVVLTLLVVILVLCICRKGTCNKTYQKGQHLHENGGTPMGLNGLEMESPCHHHQPYCHWTQGLPDNPNTFIRYGQDIDNSSLRNGSLTRCQGVDLSSTCSGTDKVMMQIEEEEGFVEDGYSPGMLQASRNPGDIPNGGMAGRGHYLSDYPGGYQLGPHCGAIPLPHLQHLHMPPLAVHHAGGYHGNNNITGGQQHQTSSTPGSHNSLNGGGSQGYSPSPHDHQYQGSHMHNGGQANGNVGGSYFGNGNCTSGVSSGPVFPPYTQSYQQHHQRKVSLTDQQNHCGSNTGTLERTSPAYLINAQATNV